MNTLKMSTKTKPKHPKKIENPNLQDVSLKTILENPTKF
jgi:hypothetical protein